MNRLRSLLGDKLVGVFDAMGKDTPLPDCITARDQARNSGADMLIGLGAGSVIQAARVVAILLAEVGPPEELITQYPVDGGAARSPRLNAPKLPIINILTAGTAAQNRGGAPAKVEGLDRRMEFFDPKTRPVALYWDEDVLATAPQAMMRATAGYVFWRAAMNMGYISASHMVDANRREAFALAHQVVGQVGQSDADTQARVSLCVATYLQNLEIDLGGTWVHHWVERTVYAVAAAIFNLFPHVSQGAAHSALTPTFMRRFGPRDPLEMRQIARALGTWVEDRPLQEAAEAAAAGIERVFAGLALPTRLRDLEIPRGEFDRILANSMQNYNADPRQEFRQEKAFFGQVLAQAW